MKRGLIASMAALLSSLLAASLVLAQGSYPLNDTFDTTVSGWTATVHLVDGTYMPYASLTWLASKDLNTATSTTTASGVVKVDYSGDWSAAHWPDIQKSVYLQPGHYQVKFRGGAELALVNVNIQLLSGVTNSTIMLSWLTTEFTEMSSDVFTVIQPGLVTIVISGDGRYYLDRVQVVPYTGPTPTPYTTLAVTPIPTQYQATPMPASTQFCQAALATPTGPAGFDVTPTATPDTSGDWQVVDAFSEDSLSGQWMITGAGGVVNPNISGPDGLPGVLEMPFSLGSGIVLYHNITPTIYFDGWAMANALPTGITATVNVQLWDTSVPEWVDVGSVQFGSGQWYPFHLTITEAGGPYTALVFRLAGPAGDHAYLDNIYVYNSLRGAPVCNQIWTPGGAGGNGYILYPSNKACPPENSSLFDVPNNFWGPLFYWMSIQFLKITALFPFHIFQGYALAIRAFADAPFWKYVAAVGMMFDLRPIILMAGMLIMLEIVRLLYSLWRLLLKIIPMMG